MKVKLTTIIFLSTLIAGSLNLNAKEKGTWIRTIYNYSKHPVTIIDSDQHSIPVPANEERSGLNLHIGMEKDKRTTVAIQGIRIFNLFDKKWKIYYDDGLLVDKKTDEVLKSGMAWGHRKKKEVVLYITPRNNLRMFPIKKAY